VDHRLRHRMESSIRNRVPPGQIHNARNATHEAVLYFRRNGWGVQLIIQLLNAAGDEAVQQTRQKQRGACSITQIRPIVPIHLKCRKLFYCMEVTSVMENLATLPNSLRRWQSTRQS